MITKLGKINALSVMAPVIVNKVVTKDLTDKDYERLAFKNKVGRRFPIKWYLQHKMRSRAAKFGKLIPTLLDDLNKGELKDHPAITYGVIPAAEVLGAYYQGKKELKKLGGVLSDTASGVRKLPGETMRSFSNPIGLGLSAYNVASGKSSVGEEIGGTVGGVIGGAGFSKLVDPLINLIPHPGIKAVARVGSFLGSMLAGGYVGNKGSNIMKNAPIFKRKNYDDIQQYYNNDNLS